MHTTSNWVVRVSQLACQSARQARAGSRHIRVIRPGHRYWWNRLKCMIVAMFPRTSNRGCNNRAVVGMSKRKENGGRRFPPMLSWNVRDDKLLWKELRFLSFSATLATRGREEGQGSSWRHIRCSALQPCLLKPQLTCVSSAAGKTAACAAIWVYYER
jgi:hypothetical protein